MPCTMCMSVIKGQANGLSACLEALLEGRRCAAAIYNLLLEF